MTESLETLSEYERLLLNMEDVIERRIRIDKEACAELGRDWQELYDGECESCGRVYEVWYLVDQGYQSRSLEYAPDKGDCIPCWRKKTDLSIIDRRKTEEIIE
jgi:hypothetical protein